MTQNGHDNKQSHNHFDSYALIFIPGTGILEAYSSAATEAQTHNAVGFFLMAWFIFTSVCSQAFPQLFYCDYVSHLIRSA